MTLVLLDTNTYLRLAKRIRPLLGVKFGQKDYVLTVLKDVEDEVRRSPKLRFNHPWFDEATLGAERDGKVIMAALFRQVGGGEVHRDVLVGHAETDGVQRVPDALAALGHRLVRQPDDGERRDGLAPRDHPDGPGGQGGGRDDVLAVPPVGTG